MIALIWIVCLVGMIYGYTRLWRRETDGKIELTIRVGEDGLIDGDLTEGWVVLENFSWLPIPWVEISQELPEGMLVQEGEGFRSDIVFRTFLLPRQRVQRRYSLFVKRGLHKFDKAAVQYGDGIGLRDVGALLEVREQVLVRPRPLEDFALPIRLTELVGEKAVLRWYQEDTSRLQGVRSYQLGDPYRHIHWAATARVGELMVKQFETTSETDFYVLVNMQFFDPFWTGTNKAIVEHQCRLAASLLHQADEQGYLSGLYTNGSWTGVGGAHVPIGRGPGHLEEMLSSLGAIFYRASGPFAEVLHKLRGRFNNRSTVVIITAYWDEEIAREVEHLREEGHNLVLIAFDRALQQLGDLPPSIPVIPIEMEDSGQDILLEAEETLGEAVSA